MKIYTLLFFLLITSASYAQVQELFENEAVYHHFNGTVLVSEDENVKYNLSFGYADLEKNILINDNTRFDIGSLTKQFTAAGILYLVNEKKLSLNDKINNHLGKYAQNEWKKVTIHHLLTHTSGIPSIYQTEQGLDIFFPEERIISLEDLIDKFASGKLINKPGKEFNYSNSGYVLLAAIIENISGTSYKQFIQSEIFDRYGLEHTSFSYDDNSALPYFGYMPSNVVKAPLYHTSWSIGAGGAFSNTKDLSKWVKVIMSDDFLTPDLRTAFLTNHTKDITNIGYGYGWQIRRDGIIEHDGGTYGFVSFLSFNPDSKDHHVILTNRSFEEINDFGKSGDKIRSLSDKIWETKNDKEIEIHPSRTTDKISSVNINLENGDTLSIQAKNNELYSSLSNSNIVQTIPNTPIKGDSEFNKNLIKISKHLEKGQYWRFASYCNGEMKFVTYTGLFRFGFGQMKKRVGDNLELIPFLVNDGSALIRMKGDKGSLHIIIYFNDDGKIDGVFDLDFYNPSTSLTMKSYPIGKNQLFVDGFPYGENSATLTFKPDVIVVEQFGREVSLKKSN